MIYNFEKLTFNVLSAAKFTHTDGFFRVKGRPYSALSLRTGGTGTFYADGKSFLSVPGDVLFIPAYTDYEVRYKKSSSTVIHLIDCSYNRAENISSANSAMLRLCFDELSENNGKFNIQKSLLYKILGILESSQKSHDTDLQSCIEFMEQNFTDPQITVADICKNAHISESTLNRKIRDCLGVSCKQYITNLRLNKAVDMLICGNFSVKQISYQCGFNDEKYFSRLIKSKYGTSPSHFRL